MFNMKKIFVYDQASSSIDALAWVLDGLYLASSSNLTESGPNRERVSRQAEVQVWQAVTGAVRCTYRGHTAAVISITCSPDGQRIASAGWDRTVQIWDAVHGTPLFTYEGHLKEQIKVVIPIA